MVEEGSNSYDPNTTIDPITKHSTKADIKNINKLKLEVISNKASTDLVRSWYQVIDFRLIRFYLFDIDHIHISFDFPIHFDFSSSFNIFIIFDHPIIFNSLITLIIYLTLGLSTIRLKSFLILNGFLQLFYLSIDSNNFPLIIKQLKHGFGSYLNLRLLISNKLDSRYLKTGL